MPLEKAPGLYNAFFNAAPAQQQPGESTTQERGSVSGSHSPSGSNGLPLLTQIIVVVEVPVRVNVVTTLLQQHHIVEPLRQLGVHVRREDPGRRVRCLCGAEVYPCTL